MSYQQGENWLVCIETAGAGVERAGACDDASVQWLGIATG